MEKIITFSMAYMITHKSRQSLLVLVFLLSVFALFAEETKADTLEISGIISAKFYRDSSTFNSTSNWFVATIDGNNTRINAGSMGDPAISDFEYGMLDKDSYVII